MLVHRFVELHGPSACDTLASETDVLRGEILRELADRRAASAASGNVSPGQEEYDPDDVEVVAIRDSTGAPTGAFRPKLFAPPLHDDLLDAVEIVRATHHAEGSQCIICQEDICYGQKLCKLPVCGHQLCTACGFEWLSICGSCPVCRRVVSAADFILEDRSSTPNSFCCFPATPLAPTQAPTATIPHPQIHLPQALSHSPLIDTTTATTHPQVTNALDSIMIPTASIDVHRPASATTQNAVSVPSPMPRPASCSRLPRTQPSSLPTDNPTPFSPLTASLLKRPSTSSVESLRNRIASAATASTSPSNAAAVASPLYRHVGTAYDIFTLPDRRWEPKALLTRPSSAPMGQPAGQHRVIMTAPPPRPQMNATSVYTSQMRSPSLLGEAVRFSVAAPVCRSPLVLAPSVQLYHHTGPPKGVVPASNTATRQGEVPLTSLRPALHSRPNSASTHLGGIPLAAEAHRVVVAAKERPPSGALRRPPSTSAAALAARRSRSGSQALPSYGPQKRLQRPGAMSLTVDGTSLTRTL
jgi:hypothetical protein